MTDHSQRAEKPRNPSRRNFLATVGAGIASVNAAACIRKPYERILPYAKRPEDLVPGEPRYFASAFNVGGSVQGVLVKSVDGRPIKVDGNPRHPMSGGASNGWAQASVLSLYEPERSRAPMQGDSAISLADAAAALDGLAKKMAATQGQGFAVLTDEQASPTLSRLLSELKTKYPNVELFRHDDAAPEHAEAGAAMVGLSSSTWTISGQPRVIAAFDADPLATDGDSTAFTRAFAHGRSPKAGTDANRLYSVEPYVSLTGANADHRLAVRSSEVGAVLAQLAGELRSQGLDLPELPGSKVEAAGAFVKALAEDLAGRPRGSTVVLVGDRQSPQVHALGLLINGALGNFGRTLKVVGRNRPGMGSLADLAKGIEGGSVKTLVVLGGNPAFTAPADLSFAAALEKIETVHIGQQRDETGRLAKIHIPASHYLESWGDRMARDGTISIQQPLIAPLYDSTTPIEVVGRLMGDGSSAYEQVRRTHRAQVETSFEKAWQKWLHDGVVSSAVSTVPEPALDGAALASAWEAPKSGEGMELAFIRDATVLDGRFATSPWLQELPDPITKLTWDNAALMSPETAAKLNVKNEQLVTISASGGSVTLPAWIQPGTAADTVVLALGYGRGQSGKFASAGFDVASLRSSASPFTTTGAQVAKAGGTYPLACAQVETSLHGRTHIRSTDRTDFTEHPNFVEKFEVMDSHHIDSLLWDEPNPEDGNQWAMTIDLSSCTGCGSCTVACQAENNIPWVGKEDVRNGREMHWIRIDRYFDETAGDLDVKVQPIACVHCETAPCENVCPVGATVHSPSGMNDMAYNRCIGTRYCANNCPYKVRRFNFFHYTVRNDEDYGMGISMQRNPDVTVRYRGVMEKCSYCVQRINRARIDAKLNNDGVIEDGAVVTACQQACPSSAIVFGNMNDSKSKISKSRHDPRSYAVAAELNIRPRTTYLAAITNPNPKLKTHSGDSHDHQRAH